MWADRSLGSRGSGLGSLCALPRWRDRALVPRSGARGRRRLRPEGKSVSELWWDWLPASQLIHKCFRGRTCSRVQARKHMCTHSYTNAHTREERAEAQPPVWESLHVSTADTGVLEHMDPLSRQHAHTHVRTHMPSKVRLQLQPGPPPARRRDPPAPRPRAFAPPLCLADRLREGRGSGL